MEAVGGDLFATKGLEYMLVIGYLLLLVACRRMVGPRRLRSSRGGESDSHPEAGRSFALREGLYFHQGHAWVAPDEEGVVRVGVDDFAQRLVGPVTGVILPRIGAGLNAGEVGWKVRARGRVIPILSPVEGVVLAWNEEVLRTPGRLNSEPYDGGWLLKVRVRNPAAATRNLLTGNVARAWMDQVVEGLGDASAVVSSSETGLAGGMAPDAWEELARALLLSEEDDGGTNRESDPGKRTTSVPTLVST